MTAAAWGYLSLPADERFETRLPAALKRHAEDVAKARGTTLSEFVLAILAEHVAEEIVSAQEWVLTGPEQAELLRVLARPVQSTAALDHATRQADELFGL